MTGPGCLLGCLLTWGSGCGRNKPCLLLTLAPSGERRICGTVKSSKSVKRKGASETVLWNNAPLILFQSEFGVVNFPIRADTECDQGFFFFFKGSSLIHGVQATPRARVRVQDYDLVPPEPLHQQGSRERLGVKQIVLHPR